MILFIKPFGCIYWINSSKHELFCRYLLQNYAGCARDSAQYATVAYFREAGKYQTLIL